MLGIGRKNLIYDTVNRKFRRCRRRVWCSICFGGCWHIFLTFISILLLWIHWLIFWDEIRWFWVRDKRFGRSLNYCFWLTDWLTVLFIKGGNIEWRIYCFSNQVFFMSSSFIQLSHPSFWSPCLRVHMFFVGLLWDGWWPIEILKVSSFPSPS